MIVIFDIDDCLMPWAEVVHQACAAAGLTTSEKLWTQWNMWKDYGCTLEQWLEVVNGLVVPNGIYHAPPYPGVGDALRDLADQGHEIHLVTARGFFDHAEEIRQWTKDWIVDFEIPGKLWFSQEKGEVAKEIGATHAIDDRIDNVHDLVNAGVDAYLMTQPHNVSAFVHPSKRVNSVPEFVEKILNGV